MSKPCKTCECCNAPTGENPAVIRSVYRNVCDQCLGFIYRWILDVEAQQNGKPLPTLGDRPVREEKR